MNNNNNNSDFITDLIQIINQIITNNSYKQQQEEQEQKEQKEEEQEEDLNWNEITSILLKKGYKNITPEICLKQWIEITYGINNNDNHLNEVIITPQFEQSLLNYSFVSSQEVYQYLKPIQSVNSLSIGNIGQSQTHSTTEKKQVTCCICSKCYISLTSLYNHLQKTHTESQYELHAKEIALYKFSKPLVSQAKVKNKSNFDNHTQSSNVSNPTSSNVSTTTTASPQYFQKSQIPPQNYSRNIVINPNHSQTQQYQQVRLPFPPPNQQQYQIQQQQQQLQQQQNRSTILIQPAPRYIHPLHQNYPPLLQFGIRPKTPIISNQLAPPAPSSSPSYVNAPSNVIQHTETPQNNNINNSQNNNINDSQNR